MTTQKGPIPGNPRTALAGAVLAVLALALYAPVLAHGLVWDDAALLAGDPAHAGLRGLWTIWTASAFGSDPLAQTTVWLLRLLCGPAPWAFHLAGLALHAAAAVLAWRWLEALRVRGAWFAAALFAVHPLQVEAVAWASQLRTLQAACFFLASLLAFERGARRLAFLAFAAAVLSRSSSVVLPGVALLVLWWRAAAGGGSCGAALRAAASSGRSFAPYLALGLGAAAWIVWAHAQDAGGAAVWAHGWRLRVASAGQAAWFYLFKFAWPHPLCLVYPPWTLDPARWSALIPTLAAAGLAVCLWLVPQRWARHALACAGFYAIALLPSLGLFSFGRGRAAPVADHLAYLPLLGLCAGAGALVFGLPARARAAVAAALLAACAAGSMARLPAFHDEAALWTDTLAKNPGAWAVLNNIGAGRQARGDLVGARWYFEEALRRNPDHCEALVNLGSLLLAQGETDGAVARYERALALQPGHPVALVNLGLALAQQGRVEDALARLREALRAQPGFIEAHVKAAGILERAGRFEEAAGEWAAALTLKGIDAAGAADFFRKRADEFERLGQPVAMEVYRRRGGRAGQPGETPSLR